MLSANGIIQWRVKRPFSATTYLCYPLTSSAQQMSSYLDRLVVKLEKLAIILTATVKNFQYVKFQDCQRPRNEGGTTILDPSTQHSALQLRWLTPLFLSSDQAFNPDSFATSLMRYTLCALSFAPSPVLPLPFPERRPTDLHKTGYFNSLFKTINQMDFEINWMALNTSSAAEIPLSRICPLLLINDPDYTCNYWKSNLVKDLYRFSTVNGRLTPIISFLSRKHRNRSEAYFDFISLAYLLAILELASHPGHSFGTPQFHIQHEPFFGVSIIPSCQHVPDCTKSCLTLLLMNDVRYVAQSNLMSMFYGLVHLTAYVGYTFNSFLRPDLMSDF
ncbi:hypothetical protein G6F43_010522 [Rhizopus delemar]|nr:hypothetical protein G6F43_010522 [Rhizopus delemar]